MLNSPRFLVLHSVKTLVKKLRPGVIFGSGSLLLLLLGIGCFAKEVVQVRRVPTVDFSSYQTWDLRPRLHDGSTEPGPEEIALGGRVLDRLQIELARRGFRYQANDADLEIEARLEVQPERRVRYEHSALKTLPTFHHGVNYEIQSSNRRVLEGHRVRLTIRVVDSRRDLELWRADYDEHHVGRVDWSDRSNDDLVKSIVALTLARFPQKSTDPGRKSVDSEIAEGPTEGLSVGIQNE
jgi:hypothetical protein